MREKLKEIIHLCVKFIKYLAKRTYRQLQNGLTNSAYIKVKDYMSEIRGY